MKWLEKHEDLVKLNIKLMNQYASLYSKGFDYGNGISLSFAEAQVIEGILDNDEIKMIHLAKALGCSGPAITKSIKKLEQKGIVEKYKIEGNKKEVRLRISSLGLETYRMYQAYVFENLFSPLFQLLESKEKGFENDLIEMYKYMTEFNDEMKER